VVLNKRRAVTTTIPMLGITHRYHSFPRSHDQGATLADPERVDAARSTKLIWPRIRENQKRARRSSGGSGPLWPDFVSNLDKVFFYQTHHIRECLERIRPSQTAHGYAIHDIRTLLEVRGRSHGLQQLASVSVAY